MPKTGSDGAGYEFARSARAHDRADDAGARAAAARVCSRNTAFTRISPACRSTSRSAMWVDGAVATRLSGALLWTHFGISGPVVLNASRHWARARLEGTRGPADAQHASRRELRASRRALVSAATARPRATLRSMLAADLPEAVAVALLKALDLPIDLALADLARDDRRRIVHALTAWPLPVTDTRGYNFAEVTAGGVDLGEIDPVDDGIARVSGAVPGRRDSRRGRTHRRIQLPVGLVERRGGRGSARAIVRSWDGRSRHRTALIPAAARIVPFSPQLAPLATRTSGIPVAPWRACSRIFASPSGRSSAPPASR